MLSREIVSRSYSYDRGGNLTRIVDGHWGWSQIETDPADRLVSVLREQGTNESFRYNKIGNLTNISESNKNKFEFPINYSQGNRLTAKNNINYIYDKNGRRIKQTTLDGTTERQDWCYEWNAIDQLTGISRPDQRSWIYIYDALGRRIKKVESTPSGDRNNTERTTYIWHESTIVHELDFLKDSTIPFDSGWLYIPNTFTPLAKLTADSFQSVICNHLGTPQELITDKADVNFLRTRKSWGNHDSGESQTAKHFQDEAYCSIVFPGQHFDIESGLCQNLYRFYDPNTHSYLSHDPLGLIPGTNLYTYVCNPFRYIDPFGLCDKLYRRGPRDSKKLLESQAAAAEKSDIGIHGVSVSSSSAAKEGQVVRSASRADIEAAGFTIHKTGKDPNHFTVELPKPVTPDVARTFNDLFK
jgi:RHS repeat-associated protein